MAARFFVAGRHESGEIVPLDGSDAHKARNVLRKASGDAVEIIDSAGRTFQAVLQVDGRAVNAVLGTMSQAPEEVLQLTVAQGLPKAQKMDFVIEKLTELGVHTIVPLTSDRVVAGDVSPGKLERWKRLAAAACAQCGRSHIPEILEPITTAALTATFANYDCVLFAWELAEQRPLRETLPALVTGARRVLLVIGPEGGFTHAEASLARDGGAALLWLGPRILRTETAALAVASVLNYLVE